MVHNINPLIRLGIIILCLTLCNVLSSGEIPAGNAVSNNQNGNFTVSIGGKELTVYPYEFGCVRITYGEHDAVKNRRSFAVPRQPAADTCAALTDAPEYIEIKTKNYTVKVSKTDGDITIFDSNQRQLLNSRCVNAGGDDKNASAPSCRFQFNENDALYGLGQYRDGKLNLRGCKRELVQFNTQSAVPVIYSTGGWGVMWDNASRTIYEDTPEGMTFTSDLGDVTDYYIFTGNNLDDLIGNYRRLTGGVPMLPYWALGYHQSRNRYHSSDEILEVARRMKEESIPMSSIFIDYHHWGKYGTGSFRFDENFFPDVEGMLDSLHSCYDTHAIITMWPCFKPGTPNHKAMSDNGYLLEGAQAIDGTVYDAFNPLATKLYADMCKGLMALDIDGWFLDGVEPDHVESFLKTTTAAGRAPEVRNAYCLVHNEAFRRAIDKVRPGKRHYILTRCAFAGQQRTGCAIWSGDIPTGFEELRTQIAAGLNFTASGLPYWTTDIGGYLRGDPKDPSFRELFVRWFQFGTFCPIFRNHGRREPFDTYGPNELWAYGDTVMKICSDYINLRYRLMPYIYSLSAMVSTENYTPMRLLAFDFPHDPTAKEIDNEFMYGPALLICPVTEAGVTQQSIYLPSGTKWIDMHTGNTYAGGTTVIMDAPLNRMPVMIKAGSIIPMNERILSTPDPDANIILTVYGGDNGQFKLYDDDGVTTAYEQGEYSLIPMSYDDSSHTLTLDDAEGKMADRERRFTIVFKGTEHRPATTHEIVYTGKKMKVRL